MVQKILKEGKQIYYDRSSIPSEVVVLIEEMEASDFSLITRSANNRPEEVWEDERSSACVELRKKGGGYELILVEG